MNPDDRDERTRPTPGDGENTVIHNDQTVVSPGAAAARATAQEYERRIGSTLGGFVIEEVLGAGGMGVVYRARDPRLDRPVALKMVRADILGPEGRERFLREARACSRINHPNIVTVYASGEEEGQPYLAMELLEGSNLREVVTREPIDQNRALRWTGDILSALGQLHFEGIVHRDLKPDNIMVTANGAVKLMDFGLAYGESDLSLTEAGTTLGTANYMSPEQVAGQKADARSDVFSMGVVLYQMLSGRLPFTGEHPMSVMYAIQNAEHDPVSSLEEPIDDELRAMVDKALAKDPDGRYSDAEAFRAAIASHLGETYAATSIAAGSRRSGGMSRRAVVLTVMLLVVVAAGIGVVLMSLRGEKKYEPVAILHNENGYSAQVRGDWVAAAEGYRAAILADPSYPVAWNNLGLVAYRNQAYAEADSLLRKAIELDPKFAGAYKTLGDMKWDQGQHDEAEAAFRSAIGLDPTIAGNWNNLGAMLNELGRYAEAEELLVDGIASVRDQRDVPRLHYHLGNAVHAQGRTDEARAIWEQGRQLDPDNEDLNKRILQTGGDVAPVEGD